MATALESIIDRIERKLSESDYYKTEALLELIENWDNIKKELLSKLEKLYRNLEVHGIRVANVLAHIDDNVKPSIKVIVFVEWNDKYLSDYEYSKMIATIIDEVDKQIGLRGIDLDVVFGRPIII